MAEGCEALLCLGRIIEGKGIRMRIIEGLIYQLRVRDFIHLDIKVKGVHLFYRPVNSEADIVILFHAPSGNEMSKEEYRYILDNIKEKFNESGFRYIYLLGMIFTDHPDKARRFCLEEDDHWIVDLTDRRLIIYENQAPEFMGLKIEVEHLLSNEQFSTDMQVFPTFLSDKEEDNDPPHKREWITPLNTVLIAANILIYLIVHYTKLFGSTDQVMAQGALSWYYVKEEHEYYRILTSMFLHSDFGHIVNNMLVLFVVGDNLERAAGKIKYLLIYFGTGILAAVSSISYNMIKDENVFSIGASGAIFGVVGAMAYIILVNKGRLEDMSGRQILFFAIFSLYGGIASVNIDNAAHIGGFLAGVVLALLLYRRKKTGIKENTPV
jgi:rhomboid protease GluP